MPFQAYLPAGFSHDHENLIFDALVRSLQAGCATLSEPHVLIGKISLFGDGLDCIFIKRDAICVIEIKNRWPRISNLRRLLRRTPFSTDAP